MLYHTMMHVPVDDQHSLTAPLLSRHFRGDCDIVVDAEPHWLINFGMVARGSAWYGEVWYVLCILMHFEIERMLWIIFH